VTAHSVWRLGYGLGYRGSRFRFLARAGNFSLHNHFQNVSGTHPPGVLSLEIKRPMREAGHSHSSSTEIKNAWSYTSTPPTCLQSVIRS